MFVWCMQDSQIHITNETRLLANLSHRFIVSLYHVCQDEQCVYLLTDFVSGGEWPCSVLSGLALPLTSPAVLTLDSTSVDTTRVQLS